MAKAKTSITKQNMEDMVDGAIASKKKSDRNNFLFAKPIKKDAEVSELMDVMLEEGKSKTVQISLEEPADYDPNTNHDAISIVKQSDGNYKGYMFKNGKIIEVREVGPETVLQRLLTHE